MPVFTYNHLQYMMVAAWLILLVGCFPSRPIPQVKSMYCAVGRDTASKAIALVCGTSMLLKNASHAAKVTSCSLIQKAEIETFFCGRSSSSRMVSVDGLPMVNDPAGIGSILNFIAVPGSVCS